ncbi:hypothetical protein M758_12G009100 [Ceratodon purpureus]|nr:hypothetical protein M758_12G009100 [Ceratodon purpureus]
MASTSGGVTGDVHTTQTTSYNRTGSGASIRSHTMIPAENLQTVQSGIQADWGSFKRVRPSWVTRNDSTKAHYVGSDVNVGLTGRLKRGVGLHDTRKADVWRAAAVEFVATTGFTFLSIIAYQESSKASVAAQAFLQAMIYSLTILAAAPISGGHLNPAITIITFLTGQATLVRSLLYVVAQLSGGILGATAVRFLTAPEVRTKYCLGGCLLQELPAESAAIASVSSVGSVLTNRQGLLAETVFTIIMLYVVYGVGFDTRSIVVTFPIISPFVIGGVFGMLIFISQGLGYTAVMNPARCLGPAVVYRHELWEPLCVFTIGPLIAAVIVGIFLLLVNQGNDNEFGPVLPLNFFQTVIPDHQRPGFGPRSTSVFYPAGLDQEIFHSQRHSQGLSQQLLAANIPGTTTSSEVLTPSDPSSGSKYSLTLQIKAFMQPKGMESRRMGSTNMVDVGRFDQNVMLQQYSNSRGSSDGVIHHIGDPEKDR